MHKTTVYLNDEEVESLRQLAAATGRSQAELIREAIRHVAAQAPPRQFRSLGKGSGTGTAVRSWNPAAVYAKLFPDSDSASSSDSDVGPSRR
jgi:hypothetical protein